MTVATTSPEALITPIQWGHSDPQTRGPIIHRTSGGWQSNVAGAHMHATWRGLSSAKGVLKSTHRPDLRHTMPLEEIVRPNQNWFDPNTIVTLDPFGHQVSELFKQYIAEGAPIMPTIAMTTANCMIPEISSDLNDGHMRSDGVILKSSGEIAVTKIYINPVWYIPGLAARLNIDEQKLRTALSDETNGMYAKLLTDPETNVLLPHIPGTTLYIFGDPRKLWDPKTLIASRSHDECNSSDVFGSDICTCRPYLMHGASVCIEMAQAGGAGIIAYNHKEARNLGTVIKYLVYQARSNDPNGDRPEDYFGHTERIAGVADARFQEFMPDVYRWLGITRIDRLVSMSKEKYDAFIGAGIEIVERVSIPERLIPARALEVEMAAKVNYGGYHRQASPQELCKSNFV